MEPKFLIAGTGRSGSGYISKVLRMCGINCGHEEYFGLNLDERKNLDGDSSWIGTFNKDFGGLYLGQFRDPTNSIPSLASSHMRVKTLDYDNVRAKNVDMSGTREDVAMRIWITYNEEVLRRARFWWRVEDVDKGTVRKIASLAGMRVHGVSNALSKVNNVENSRPKDDFVWPDNRLTSDVVSLAKTIGYHVEL